jgi:hypothetical protein
MSNILNGRAGRIILVLAGLLLAASVLPAASEPAAGAVSEPRAGEAVEPRAWYTMTVPASSFIPTQDNWDYYNAGYYVESTTGTSAFTATVPFPFPSVTVRQVILHAYDSEAGSDICLRMYRAKPVGGTYAKMANVCSTGDSFTDPRAFKDVSITASVVQGYTSAYLSLTVPPGNQRAYGVTIKYTA